ncbi:hypothetical protein CaLGV109 [Clostera anastomosis granulovirus A]|uniref:Uncharacterized protein n=1 Tax=Clostera anastomosis granulovirus A TaxID=1986289 RepID=U5KAW9_9BBAC|nr:hypothetical protein CaLGV109 [Clostera anastomosis granulovirus Henan]AGQ20367.1 hypothetical protein CaLGV109 [Clostera anastomosis granulovirus Henan]
MIRFTKASFGNRRVAIVQGADKCVYFKLIEVLRILFKTCGHTYIDDRHVTVFSEFPNTKFVSITGLMLLTDLSPLKDAKNLQLWALEQSFKIHTQPQ